MINFAGIYKKNKGRYKVQGLEYTYDLWMRLESGKVVTQYLVWGPSEKYQFPTEEEMITKADESFLFVWQVPKKIIIEEDRVRFIFTSKTFKTKEYREARDAYFQWVIDHSREVK